LPSTNTTTATYEWSGLTFEYPSTWTVQEEADRLLITTFDPANRPAMAEWTQNTMEMELRIVTPAFASLREWADAAIPNFVGVDVFDRGDVTLANGSPAIQIDLVSGSGHLITNYYALVNDQQVFISYTAGSPTPANLLIQTLR
jgi:hypothetical protein